MALSDRRGSSEGERVRAGRGRYLFFFLNFLIHLYSFCIGFYIQNWGGLGSDNRYFLLA